MAHFSTSEMSTCSASAAFEYGRFCPMYLKARDESVSSLIFRSSCSGVSSMNLHKPKGAIKVNPGRTVFF